MNQYYSEIVVALIVGAFSVISLIVQKKQDKVVEGINEFTITFDQEKVLRKQMDTLSRKREGIIHDMMILIMDSNLELMKSIDKDDSSTTHKAIYDNAYRLKDEFKKTDDELEELNRSYDMMIQLSNEAKKKIADHDAKKKK